MCEMIKVRFSASKLGLFAFVAHGRLVLFSVLGSQRACFVCLLPALAGLSGLRFWQAKWCVCVCWVSSMCEMIEGRHQGFEQSRSSDNDDCM